MHSLFDACLMGQGNHVFVPSLSAVESVQTWGAGVGNAGGAYGWSSAAGEYQAVLAGNTDTIGVYYSPDDPPVAFSNSALPTSTNYSDVVYDSAVEHFICCSYSTSKAAYTDDADASPWDAAGSFPLSSGLLRLASMGGTTIAMQSGVLSTAYAISTNGAVTWASQTFPDSRNISDVFVHGDKFVALATSGDVYTSTTGLTGSWTKNATVLASGVNWYGSSNGTRIVVFKYNTNVFGYSDDAGASFTMSTLPASQGAQRVRWSGEMFVAHDAIAGRDKFYYSEAGDAFSSYTLPSATWNTALVVLSSIKVLIAGTNKSCVITLGAYT